MANEKRNKASDEAGETNRIIISKSWMSELTSHPYFSSKYSMLIFKRKAWHWSAFTQRESKTSEIALPKEGAYNWKAAPFTSYQQGGRETKWLEARKTIQHWV